MSSIGVAYGLSNAWDRAQYGVTNVKPIERPNQSGNDEQSSLYAKVHSTVDSATVTKRMADGDMVVINISGGNVVSTRAFAHTGVNLATHLDHTESQQHMLNSYRNSLDSILSGSFINVTA